MSKAVNVRDLNDMGVVRNLLLDVFRRENKLRTALTETTKTREALEEQLERLEKAANAAGANAPVPAEVKP